MRTTKFMKRPGEEDPSTTSVLIQDVAVVDTKKIGPCFVGVHFILSPPTVSSDQEMSSYPDRSFIPGLHIRYYLFLQR